MRKVGIIALSAVALLSSNSYSFDSGFLLYEHGAAAMAIGGAFVSLANNPSAVFHNPAGVAWLERTQISIGTTWITAKSSVNLPLWPDPTSRSVNQENLWFYPSTLYISSKMSEKVVAGFGFFSAYGLGTKWPGGYPLRYIAVSDEMNTYFLNPILSFKLSENLSLGFGFSYIYSTLDLELFRLVEGFDVPVSLGTNGNTWGLNAGVLYRGEQLSFGFNWRGGFRIDYRGNLRMDTSQLSPDLQLLLPTQGNVSTTFRFPHIFGLGISFHLSENVIFATDVHYILWSSYDRYTVKVDFSDPFPDEENETVEDWKNSFALRTGLEFQINPSLALRTGILYDKTPQPKEAMDPALPDADRVGLTGGLGYKTGRLAVDLAYQLELFLDRKSPNRNVYLDSLTGVNLGEGTYSTTAHLIGISIGYIF